LVFNILGGVGTDLPTKVDNALVDHNPAHALFGFFTLNNCHFFRLIRCIIDIVILTNLRLTIGFI
jgi:hypothetical protein